MMSALTLFLDAHGTSIKVIACIVVVICFAFVAASVLGSRQSRHRSF